MAKTRRGGNERNLARRRDAAERIGRGVEEIRKEIAKAGPPKETITETIRRMREGTPKDDGA